MLKDCIEFAKGCQGCQKYVEIQRVPASELHAIIKPWPFRGWAVDVIGEIKPTSSKGYKYILVGIDYFTKWIEAIPLKDVTQDEVISFIQKSIIYRFGIPETITTDQGSVFTGRKMAKFAEDIGFKLLTSTQYYAQANVEILLQSTRIQRQCEIPVNHYWNMVMDELIDLDEERLTALEVLARQKERVAKAYNKKVKSKIFTQGDLVWKVILPMDRKDRTLGKWSPSWEGPWQILRVFSNNAYEIEELNEDQRILRINGKYLKKYKPTLQEIKIMQE
ncbi:uncharacterized protein [Medicago truncatula]|uniref:uncharacterized protein n=1 Tax=Medicago truncatula TaxID=3880 RepID=UPI00196854A9|nr:uncharacterized protein LOC120579917 [Medicago truncatula]